MTVAQMRSLQDPLGLIPAAGEEAQGVAKKVEAPAKADGDAIETFFARCREVRRKHDDILNPVTPESEQSE